MNKKTAAILVVMSVVCSTGFAANPFTDVPKDSWAYNSVMELANAGIIQGLDKTHFEGERNITRYEAAEVVAKAMAHMKTMPMRSNALLLIVWLTSFRVSLIISAFAYPTWKTV